MPDLIGHLFSPAVLSLARQNLSNPRRRLKFEEPAVPPGPRTARLRYNRPAGVFLARDWKPLLWLLQSCAGENPLQPRPASHTKAIAGRPQTAIRLSWTALMLAGDNRQYYPLSPPIILPAYPCLPFLFRLPHFSPFFSFSAKVRASKRPYSASGGD